MKTGRYPIPAVAAVIVEEGEILLVRRGGRVAIGTWALPGGKIEWGETMEQAVRREAREETGLSVEVQKIAGVFDLIIYDVEIDAHYVIVDFFARRISGELRSGDDADECRWVPLSQLDAYPLAPQLRERLKEMGVG